MSTCFLIGQSNTPHNIALILEQSIKTHITEYGVTHFVVGNYGSFDSLAAKALIKTKCRYPFITVQLLLPYHPAERPIEAPKNFDGTLYPFEKSVPRRFAIIKANQAMIDASQFLITYVTRPGNSRTLLEYGQRKEKKNQLRITNLASLGV